MRMLTISCVLLAFCACQKSASQDANEQASGAPAGTVKGADRSHKGDAVPAVTFNDPDGVETTLAAFKGRPTLVNLWASWCAPCVKELPTLDQLARKQQGRLNVVAISQDTAPHASVTAFLDSHKVQTLGAYQDPKMAISGGLHADVLPTSILYDADGREIWRYVGELDWTGPGAAKLLAEAGVSIAG
jgi:thiol-disulfide isomerase/thioredoxin